MSPDSPDQSLGGIMHRTLRRACEGAVWRDMNPAVSAPVREAVPGSVNGAVGLAMGLAMLDVIEDALSKDLTHAP